MNKRMCEQVFRDLKLIYLKGVAAVQPSNLIKKYFNFDPASQSLKLANKEYNLQNKNVYLFGAGKAVRNMSMEVESVLKDKICDGIISIPYGSEDSTCPSSYVRYREGALNNLPDSAAEQSTKQILQSLNKLNENDFVLFLISGGGSSLLPLPTEPITLKEKSDLIKSLANSGADIKELNIVRKRISSVKGGKLGCKCFPAQMVCLILSDIVGDPIELIASGPTVADHDESNAARNVLEKYNLMDKLPSSVLKVITSPPLSERFPEEYIDNYIIGSNQIAISAAVEEATQQNYNSFYMSDHITGDTRHVATCYIELCRIICGYLSNSIEADTANHLVNQLNIPKLKFDLNMIEGSKNICLVFGGETTVTVTGLGKGGRNQEMALTFGLLLNKYCEIFVDYDIYLLSAGTDGIDGPTDAAGAVSYKELVADAAKQHLDVNYYLENNDSYNFFKCFQDGRCHVYTGHTNTNVMDLQILIIRKK